MPPIFFGKLILGPQCWKVGRSPSWSSAVYGFLAQILSWETDGQHTMYILMNSCSNILRVEYLNKVYHIWAGSAGWLLEATQGQDKAHYDHNKPHSWKLQSYLQILNSQQNLWWSIQDIWLWTPMQCCWLHQMISVVCVWAGVQFLTRSDPIWVESSTSKYLFMILKDLDATFTCSWQFVSSSQSKVSIFKSQKSH